MSTPAERDPELRCAEYALGVLDAVERRALEREASADPSLAATLDAWQRRLAPLAEDVRPLAVPARVWTRIERDLGWLPARRAADAPPGTWWDNLRVWRFVGLGASAAAIALAVVSVVELREAQQTEQVAQAPAQVQNASEGYMVATIARPDGIAHWTATVDLSRHEMVVVPAVKPTIAAGRATELWLIPPGEKPIALGVFPADAPAHMTLPANVVARLSAKAILAVSIEPEGGSTTGQPTGPVVATGPMHAAA
ncbi:anti-sigma factor [Paraburkholderia acidisoli]|uniref:Anti-sigma factor n=1 Tax=Paraburkholderia acidisoli TaxID=2571748 RepID=A0A7Z2JIB9_9BURK|nr:anti-sigma factor [Paraburkholderia acidisoli]QGZ65541.1 anti-sigma factor [Paraburkholderia acidisoli]